MGITFELKHKIDTMSLSGWLWYSHSNNPPTDRPVVKGGSIMVPKSMKMANWYFLSDAAHQMLQGTAYSLVCIYYDHWFLRIEDRGIAALFKLRFM